MKKYTALLGLVLASAAFAAEAKLSPIVTVELGSTLLNFVGTCAKSQDPEAADLVKNLNSVRVKVYDFEGENVSMAEIQNEVRAQSRVSLDSSWSKIVAVNNPKEAVVDISVRMLNANEVGGIVASIANNDHKGVLVEIEGNIRADQVEKLVRRIQKNNLPGMENFAPASEKHEGKDEAKGEKSDA